MTIFKEKTVLAKSQSESEKEEKIKKVLIMTYDNRKGTDKYGVNKNKTLFPRTEAHVR